MNELERGLPSNPNAEKTVLGCVLMDDRAFIDCAVLGPEDFTLQKNRVIWRRMEDLFKIQEKIDIVTVCNELGKHKELESVDGVSYVAELTDGIPELMNVEAYVRILQEKTMLRRIIHATQDAQNKAFQCEDSALVASGLGSALQNISREQPGKGPAFPSEIISNCPGGLDGILNPRRNGLWVSTGYPDLDEIIGGFGPGQLIVIGGRPGWGKSALMSNLAQNISLGPDPKTTMIFSLEMSKDDITRRMIAGAARVSLRNIRTGFLSFEEQQRLSVATPLVYDGHTAIDDDPMATIVDMRCKVQRLQARLVREGRPPLAVVAVDYLQLMPIEGQRRNGTREQDVSALTRGLKLLAKEFQVSVLALSQLSRALEMRTNHEPQLSDLRESGSIEQDADVVMFPYRPELYSQENEALRGQAELFVAKQRDGPTGKVHMTWFRDFTRFDSAIDWRG